MPARGKRTSSKAIGRAGRAAEALRRLVDLVSHRSGLAVATMAEAAITLPQVLLLNHVERRGRTSPSEMAEAMHVSLPAVSQMIERLVQQGLLDRTEDPVDRRRKAVATTHAAKVVLRDLERARASDYESGLSPVSPELLAQLAALLRRVVGQLEDGEKASRRSVRSSTPAKAS
jgi:DNA-binding MarR family transcriptional regulator